MVGAFEKTERMRLNTARRTTVVKMSTTKIKNIVEKRTIKII